MLIVRSATVLGVVNLIAIILRLKSPEIVVLQ